MKAAEITRKIAVLETRYANMTSRCPLREKVAVRAEIRRLQSLI